jgi:DNA-binding response OmpR family regulator
VGVAPPDPAGEDTELAAIDRLWLEPFDLLLLDRDMPAMEGFALLEQRAADSRPREVVVIASSSLTGVAVASRGLALGADEYPHKPVDRALLVSTVKADRRRWRSMGCDREALD